MKRPFELIKGGAYGPSQGYPEEGADPPAAESLSTSGNAFLIQRRGHWWIRCEHSGVEHYAHSTDKLNWQVWRKDAQDEPVPVWQARGSVLTILSHLLALNFAGTTVGERC